MRADPKKHDGVVDAAAAEHAERPQVLGQDAERPALVAVDEAGVVVGERVAVRLRFVGLGRAGRGSVGRAVHAAALPPRSSRDEKMAAHPPSKHVLRASSPCASSGQATPRHMEWPAYRCFLPDLTGFAGFHCVGPDLQRRDTTDSLAERPLGREFSPAVADCGYRAPLAPRLARPPFRLPGLPGGSKRRREGAPRGRWRRPPRRRRELGHVPGAGHAHELRARHQRVEPLGRRRRHHAVLARRPRSPAAPADRGSAAAERPDPPRPPAGRRRRC